MTTSSLRLSTILASGERKQTLEHMAYAYAREMTWPKLGRRWVELMTRPAAADTTRPRPREAKTGVDRHGLPPTPASIAAIVPTTKTVGTEIPEDDRSSPGRPPDMMPSLMTHGRP